MAVYQPNLEMDKWKLENSECKYMRISVPASVFLCKTHYKLTPMTILSEFPGFILGWMLFEMYVHALMLSVYNYRRSFFTLSGATATTDWWFLRVAQRRPHTRYSKIPSIMIPNRQVVYRMCIWISVTSPWKKKKSNRWGDNDESGWEREISYYSSFHTYLSSVIFVYAILHLYNLHYPILHL